MKKRITALAMALCLLLTGAPAAKGGLAATLVPADGQAAVRIPYGEDTGGYRPDVDGYYGLLPVQYEAAQAEDGRKTMAKAYMPVLISNGHLYVSEAEIQSVLGLTVKKGGSTLLVSAYERRLALGSGNPEGLFFAGDYEDSYLSLAMPLSAAPLYYNGMVWAPLQDLCILFDLGMHQETEGEDTFITVYDPDETVIDVLAYLHNNSGACKAAYTSGDLALLGGSSAAAQLAAKMLDGDAVAWAAVALSALGFDEEGYALLLEQLADDLTVDLMCVIPDESVAAAKASVNRISDVLSLIQTELELGSNAAVDMELMDAVLEARVSASSQVNDPRWFSEALDKINALTEQKKKLEALSSTVDDVLTGVTTAFGILQTAATYASVDDISLGGVGAICANKEHLTFSNPIVLDEVEHYAAFMQSGAVNYSLHAYVSQNVGSWVLDGLSASCPVFKLMQLSTHLIPPISEGIDATHSYQVSVLAIPLQSDVERILRAELKAYPARRAQQKEFKALSETAYIYLKTCYIARNQAASALGLSGDALVAQQRQMDFLLERMSVLSAHYGSTPENAYSKAHRLRELDDSALIGHAQKQYLQLSGEVRRALDEAPVEDAHCQITNQNGEVCGFFSGTPGGSYQDQYVPLHLPDGCVAYAGKPALSASLRFTSPTVEGEDTVRAQGAPGAAVNPVETAYLEAGGVAIASDMGAIDGALYAVTTEFIEESAGIRQLRVPVDEAGHYDAVRFAYYGGRIYYLEKTPGTDDSVLYRLCCCERDGSGRSILVDSGVIGWRGLRFVIENGFITWEQYDDNTYSTFYQTYAIAEGKLVDSQSAPIPLTRLVLGEYDDRSALLVKNGDETWTLYRRMRNNEDAGALSRSLVTVDDAGNVSVAYQGAHGYIQGVKGLLAIHDGYAYLSAYENQEGILYRLNLEDAGDIRELGRHMTAGGGDAFFNY